MLNFEALGFLVAGLIGPLYAFLPVVHSSADDILEGTEGGGVWHGEYPSGNEHKDKRFYGFIRSVGTCFLQEGDVEKENEGSASEEYPTPNMIEDMNAKRNGVDQRWVDTLQSLEEEDEEEEKIVDAPEQVGNPAEKVVNIGQEKDEWKKSIVEFDAIAHQVTPETDKSNVLLTLSRENRAPSMEKYLENGTYDINARDETQRTALHYALLYKMPVAIFEKILRQENLDINQYGPNNTTALHLAAAIGQSPKVVDLLLDKEGLDVNAKDRRGQTPLHYALRANNVDMVERLLERCDPVIQDKLGNTPLRLSLTQESPEMISLLLRNRKVQDSLSDPSYKNLLHYALRWSNPLCKKKLLDELISNDHFHPSLAQMLLYRDTQGYTPRDFARHYLNHDILSNIERIQPWI